VTGLDVAPDVEAGGSGYVGAWAGISPGGRPEPFGHPHRHELAPCRVHGDLVHTVAVAIVGVQLRWVRIAFFAPPQCLGGPGSADETVEIVPVPGSPPSRPSASPSGGWSATSWPTSRDLVGDPVGMEGVSRWHIRVKHGSCVVGRPGHGARAGPP